MLDSLSQFGAAFGGFMTPVILFNVLWATFLGIVIGALPGLTATMGVALMTTLTFSMGHTEAILVLVCIYVGAIYGGSRSAILLNIPGTPASACSTLDGFPLARQGLAGRAMGISTTGSWLGTLFGVLCVATLTPVLSEAALKFQSFEFFWISLFGIVIAGTLSGGDPLKGYLAGFLGLWIATIGQEPHYNYQRFAFGIHRSRRRDRSAASTRRRVRRGRGAAVHARAGGEGDHIQDRFRLSAHRGTC